MQDNMKHNNIRIIGIAEGEEEKQGRNWAEGWTTAKSVAQEGRKVKPILPTTPSLSTARKTSRNKLTGLKPAEDFFFSSFLLSPWIPSSFLSFFFFISSSFLPFLSYSFFPSFPSPLPPSPFSFSHRWDKKTWSAEKTRVRPSAQDQWAQEIKETAPLNPIGILP